MPTVRVPVKYLVRFAKPPIRGLKPLVLVDDVLDVEVREAPALPVELTARTFERDIQWRAFEGRHWMELLELQNGRSAAEALVPTLARNATDERRTYPIPVAVARQGAFPRADVLARGVTILEDGRDEAVARINRFAEGLLVVDGVIHREAPLPEWRVGFLRIPSMSAHLTELFTPFSFNVDAPCGRFPYDRMDEALAYSRALREALAERRRVTNAPQLTHQATVECAVPGEFPDARSIVAMAWTGIRDHFEDISMADMGPDLMIAVAQGEQAARRIGADPTDAAAVDALADVIAGLDARIAEAPKAARLEGARDALLAHQLYLRMTEQLDPEDVAALSL